MRIIQLSKNTDKGEPVHLNACTIISMEGDDKGTSILVHGGHAVCVKETPDQVLDLCDEADAEAHHRSLSGLSTVVSQAMPQTTSVTTRCCTPPDVREMSTAERELFAKYSAEQSALDDKYFKLRKELRQTTGAPATEPTAGEPIIPANPQ